MGLQFNFKRAAVALVLMTIPLALFGFFLRIQKEFLEVRELRNLLDGSIETRATLAELLSEHQDIETGQRGYVITRDRAFLEPYSQATGAIDRTFAKLTARLPQEPELTAGVARLRALSARKLAFASRRIELVDSGQIELARRDIAAGQGKRLMDEIRTEIGRLDRLESSRLTRIERTRDASREKVERTIDLLIAALALLLAAVAIFTGRTIQERHAALRRVQSLSNRQRAIFDSTVDGMLLLDQNGTILELNPSVLRLFGYDEAELVGQHNTYLMAHPPTIDESQAWLAQVGAGGRRGAGNRQEFTGRRKDGSVFETDVAISRFSTSDERLYVAVIRDITERKRIETMKTEFVSTVSHELRTPLTSIGGSLGLLAAGAVGPLNEKAARLVHIAHNNCERLIRLINDMLDIEKIESGKMSFDIRRMQIGPLVMRTVAANSGFADSNGIRMTTHLPPWPQCVMGDPDKLEQLLTNLVSNAIKHSPAGGEVEIASLQRENFARIEVRDRGAGIPADFRERIFGKFAMADSSDSRAKGGTGLGLSIAREIAHRHGGVLSYADREGGGTVFFVELPLAEDSAVPLKGAGEGLPLILHVDDDADCLSVVASAFEDRAEVVSVASVGEARRALGEYRFAAAIVDVGMAPDNGLDLVPALREDNPALPVVLFTALDDPHAEVAPVDAVLVKSRTSLGQLVETTMTLAGQQSRNAA
ncbi:MAG: ATP-binding protein [Tsuneonella sp.]